MRQSDEKQVAIFLSEREGERESLKSLVLKSMQNMSQTKRERREGHRLKRNLDKDTVLD